MKTRNLTEKQIELCRLLQRSSPEDDGWTKVSEHLVEAVVENLSPLLEFNHDSRKLRFSEDGKIVMKYL